MTANIRVESWREGNKAKEEQVVAMAVEKSVGQEFLPSLLIV